jgi:hypothetical protein
VSETAPDPRAYELHYVEAVSGLTRVEAFATPLETIQRKRHIVENRIARPNSTAVFAVARQRLE